MWAQCRYNVLKNVTMEGKCFRMSKKICTFARIMCIVRIYARVYKQGGKNKQNNKIK